MVVDPSGQPLAGQRVELRRPTRDGSGQLVTSTDTNGQFAYTGLRAGRYEVELRIEGRVVATSGPIELSAETMRVRNVTLARPAPPPALPPERPHISANRLLRGRPAPTSFEALPSLLERGHEVIVTDEAGRNTKGRISSISSSRLVLVRRRFRFSRPEARGFARDSVTTIQIVDSTWNGAVLGAAAGVGFLAALIESECSPTCDDNFGRPGRWMLGGLFYLPIAAGLGSGIDSMINESIYERQNQTRRVTISPVVRRARKGVVVQIRF